AGATLVRRGQIAALFARVGAGHALEAPVSSVGAAATAQGLVEARIRVATRVAGLRPGVPGEARTVVRPAAVRGALGGAVGAPRAANLALLDTLAPHLGAGAVITDVGSVKRAIVAHAEARGLGPRFAGGHPIAGTHGHGFRAARLDLFKNAVVYITPTRDGDGAAREIAHFWEDVLATHPVLIDAAQHDRQLALTSHLPQAVASLLAPSLAPATPPGATFGPGARDATRLAASEPALWTEIFLMNRDEL